MRARRQRRNTAAIGAATSFPYNCRMETTTEGSRHLVLAAALTLAAAAATGLAFAGWLDHGATLFLSLAQGGLAWCL